MEKSGQKLQDNYKVVNLILNWLYFIIILWFYVIFSILKGRTENSVKNRYHAIFRQEWEK
jgi:hypothetical protein